MVQIKTYVLQWPIQSLKLIPITHLLLHVQIRRQQPKTCGCNYSNREFRKVFLFQVIKSKMRHRLLLILWFNLLLCDWSISSTSTSYWSVWNSMIVLSCCICHSCLSHLICSMGKVISLNLAHF